MTLIARLARCITLDLTRNPQAPSSRPKADTRAAHIALERKYAETHAELRRAVGR